MLSMMGKISADNILEYISIFFSENSIVISSKLYACIKRQGSFLGKIQFFKTCFQMWSAEFLPSIQGVEQDVERQQKCLLYAAYVFNDPNSSEHVHVKITTC